MKFQLGKRDTLMWFLRKSIFLTVSACLFLLASCTGETRATDGAQSFLIDAMLQTTDFSPGWSWRDPQSSVADVETNSEDRQFVEGVQGSLAGRYGPERYYVKFLQTVGLFEQEVSWVETVEYEESTPSGSLRLLQIDVASSLPYYAADCISDGGWLMCGITLGNVCIASSLKIYAPDEIPVIEFERIVNEAVAGVGDRILSLDDPQVCQ